MQISFERFITDTLQVVDTVTQHFVEQAFIHFVKENTTVLTLLFTVYVMLIGYRALFQPNTLSLPDLTRHVVLLMIVYSLIHSWDFYHRFIYKIFTQEPEAITKTLIDSAGGFTKHGEATGEALNRIYQLGMQAGAKLMSQGNWRVLTPYLYGFIVMVVTALSCLLALALLIYAKLAMAILLFLGPLFLCFLLFQSTRGFFEKWIQALMNYALIPIITCGMLMFMISIVNVTLPSLQQGVNDNQGAFLALLPYLGLSLVSSFLYTQILSLAAALSGGLSLTPLKRIIPHAQSLLQQTGLPRLSHQIVSKRFRR